MIKNDQKMRKIFKDFNNQCFIYGENQGIEYPKQNKVVSYVLSQISESSSEFINNEYVKYYGKTHWYERYGHCSKSKYYRDKRKAIDEFISLYNEITKLKQNATNVED